MNINLKVIYKTPYHKCLCFLHAVKAALAGWEVETEVDDYSSDTDMRTTYCVVCSGEKKEFD